MQGDSSAPTDVEPGYFTGLALHVQQGTVWNASRSVDAAALIVKGAHGTSVGLARIVTDVAPTVYDCCRFWIGYIR